MFDFCLQDRLNCCGSQAVSLLEKMGVGAQGDNGASMPQATANCQHIEASYTERRTLTSLSLSQVKRILWLATRVGGCHASAEQKSTLLLGFIVQRNEQLCCRSAEMVLWGWRA
jgi:hypothetical protein